MENTSKTPHWLAGAAAKASLGALAFAALGAFTQAQAAGAQDLAQAQASNFHAPGLSFMKADADPGMLRLIELVPGARSVVDNALIPALLAKHSNLPAAKIAAVNSRSDQGSSMAVPDPQSGMCLVQIGVDPNGLTEAPRTLSELTGATIAPGSALAKMLTEFETLHELGHCAQAKLGPKSFSHPQLSDEQNNAVSTALHFDRGAGGLQREMFADAYAGAMLLKSRCEAGRAEAIADLEIIQNWRQSATHDETKSAKPVILGGAHGTSPALPELLRDPAQYAGMDPEKAALLISSKAAASLGAAAADSAQAGLQALDPASRMAAQFQTAIPTMWSLAQEAKTPQEARSKMQGFFRGYEFGSPDEKAMLAHSPLVIDAMLAQAPEWAKPGSTSDKPIPDLQDEAAKIAAVKASQAVANDPAFQKSLASLGYGAQTQTFAKQGWERAKQAQTTGPAALAASLWIDQGKASLKSKLSTWREARSAELEAGQAISMRTRAP